MYFSFVIVNVNNFPGFTLWFLGIYNILIIIVRIKVILILILILIIFNYITNIDYTLKVQTLQI